MNLGEYIREKRKEKNMSQRDLAAASGISNAEISRIESGKRKEPSSSVLRDLAKALNVPAEEILAVVGILDSPQHEEVSTSSSGFSVTESNYLDVGDLSKSEMDELMNYIDYIKSKRKH